jgi:CheY-like chemotaxis protein
LRPAAITLDIVMPQMDGWAVLIRLKNDPITIDIPVILVTIMDDKNLGYSLGAAEYMTKPVDRQRLARKMHRLGRIKRKTLMLRMIEIVSQISAVFATPASTNDSLWLRGGL